MNFAVNRFTYSKQFLRMDSDDSYHSESEFYYPDEFEDGKNKENTPVSELQKEQDDFTLADAQDFILGQRTENTVKKNPVRP